jgi:hypothetical protein
MRRYCHLMVEVRHGCQPLHVAFFTVRIPVEPARHEVATVTFMQQATFGHVDAGCNSHLVIGVFNKAVSLRVVYAVFLVIDSIEFQQPVLEACRRFYLPRAYLVCLWVPRNNRFRPRATGRRANTQNVIHGMFRVRCNLQTIPLAQNATGKLDQCVYFDWDRPARRIPGCRPKLERPCSSLADITKPFDRAETFSITPFTGQPLINDSITEVIRERVRQQARQTMK